MTGLLRTIYELFPPHTREFIKYRLSVAGHASSWLDRIKARDHARGKKRLDLVAESLAEKFAAAGISSLRGADCLEFGAGYVPTEALVFYLIGAKSCIATDYNSIANLAQLADSAKASDRERVLHALAPFAAGVDIEQRLDAILRADIKDCRRTMFQIVKYIAPFDMSAGPLPFHFDFIHSISVFEHLPPNLTAIILTNLRNSLQPGGRMIHEIDLRDHLDLIGAPLAFLSRSDSYDPVRDFDARGNRIRKPRWLDIFSALPDTDSHVIYECGISAGLLPSELVGDVLGIAPEDLLVSWIGFSSVARTK